MKIVSLTSIVANKYQTRTTLEFEADFSADLPVLDTADLVELHFLSSPTTNTDYLRTVVGLNLFFNNCCFLSNS